MFLGNELYEQLGDHPTSMKLSKDSDKYEKLMKKYHFMIETFKQQAEDHNIKVGV